MPLSPAELAYQAIQITSEPSTTLVSTNGANLPPITVLFKYLLDEVLPSDEAIREVMSLEEWTWGEFHHRASMFDSDAITTQIPSFDPPGIIPSVYTSVQIIDSEGNMINISKNMLIDISVKMGIVENIQIGANFNLEEIARFTSLFKEFRDVFAWSYDEIPSIDPSIFEHEIKFYGNAKPVRQRLQPVHPRKVAAIKTEVKKLLHAGFIYLVPLIEWVSNPVPVDKKQGTIWVCVEYCYLNTACPKDNYPTPFIDQILDGCESFSFMGGFSGYN